MHLGARQDEGVIRYTADTAGQGTRADHRPRPRRRRHLPVPGYLQAKITQIERDRRRAGHASPEETVRQAAKTAKFSDELADAILAHFIRGGQLTAGGVLQAVTSVAQTLDDADTAATSKPRPCGSWTWPPSS